MDYQEFKNHLVTFLWKAGDAQLIASLDNLINMGVAMLNRELEIPERQRQLSTTISSSLRYVNVPTSYYSLRSVAGGNGSNLGRFRYVTPEEMSEIRETQTLTSWLPVYTLTSTSSGSSKSGTTISPAVLFAGPTSGDGLPVVIDYISNVQSLSGDEDLEDADIEILSKYLDIATYAVLYNTAPFLREDERVPLWQQMYRDAITKETEQYKHTREIGIPIAPRLPRQAGISRRR